MLVMLVIACFEDVHSLTNLLTCIHENCVNWVSSRSRNRSDLDFGSRKNTSLVVIMVKRW